MKKEHNITLKGISASSGIVIGKVFLLKNDDFMPTEEIYIPQSERAKEVLRFQEAIKNARAEMQELRSKINRTLGANYAKIAEVHFLMLEDPLMTQKVLEMINSGSKAEYAVDKFTKDIVKTLEVESDEYFRERVADIKEVSKKIIDNLIGRKDRKVLLENIGENKIVVAHTLSPAETVVMKEKFVLGFVTDMGGRTSHTAIVANGLGIPAVVGLTSITSNVEPNEEIILDGNAGLVILNPDKEVIEKYRQEIKNLDKATEELDKIKNMSATTVDGHNVEILANIENPNETNLVLSMHAAGIGLYRTEFIYFNRSDIPSENVHYEAYVKVVESMNGLPTVIRTLDLGGDKLTESDVLHLEKEKNPFMGLRAIRLCLKYPRIFIDQLRGILRASAKGKINLLYPMVSCVDELDAANEVLEKVKTDLRKENIPFDEDIKVGIMIEVPSAALISDILAKKVDFFSIGTNDLIQYSMAADRVNENVAHLYNPLHPAVLRLLKMIIDNGHKAGIKVAMCGEMAGSPFYTPILLGLGLDEFSVSIVQIPRIKKIIRSVNMEEMKKLSDEVLKCDDSSQIEQILKGIKFSEDIN
ncbi:MAG: phosphoenolpyruvate--protein phosphotransferase [Elusimicrobiota bacterium]|jgi:phosphotransferase system enzyme I (PtsI)|nr:phosphoenolpyruvate--protein phosphotransferase [Elusimicrobiota bacterium]